MTALGGGAGAEDAILQQFDPQCLTFHDRTSS